MSVMSALRSSESGDCPPPLVPASGSELVSLREDPRVFDLVPLVKRILRLKYKAEEKAAIKNLKEDKNIVILPADKENVTVVRDRTDYDDKAHKRLAPDQLRCSGAGPKKS
ncbi:hypothetical protein HPB47_027641 [Ixodes persulcatus]|uniref:Uncharacterized protein n=1 Tax=Ixodes persulcatus TaxID=34615 RepID=A0AC60PVE8_IXOPE|nr:hypothetical protein HPB47_027641 [Ixodes persulcatus]